MTATCAVVFASPHMNTPEYSETSAIRYVSAPVIAERYGVTGRYILQLAAANRIPHLRISSKCVRFDIAAVAAVLESGTTESEPSP